MASTSDGSANAPSGTPQLSNILSGYAVRPDWKVAGVDYYVGTPSGTVLKDPATISMAGVSVDKSAHVVTVSSSNVTLSGYDFGLSGGWQVEVVNNANNVTIQNSSFHVGVNDQVPIMAYYGGTINVLNNTFDGGANTGSSATNMVFTGTGGATIEYNRFTNFPDDGIDITHDGNYVVQYNVFDTMGASDYHTDAVQTFFSAISSLTIQYNTMYQPPSMSNGGINSFVRIGDQQGNVIHDPVAAYNTIIMASNNAKTASVFQWDQGGAATLVDPQIHDNFIDPTGVLYAVVTPTLQDSTGVINPVTYNNVNLTTGKPLLSGPYNNNTDSIPSKSPAAPVITSESPVSATQVKFVGAATAGTTVDVFDNGTLLGTVAVSSSGTWSYTTSTLPTGDHSFTARATDSFTNSSAPSNALAISVTSSGTTGPTGSPPSAPVAPVMASFSADSGVVGDGITNDNTPDLKGTAAANSTITIYDGTTQIGTTTASSTGSWDYITKVLTDAKHTLTATATNSSGQTSAASSALAVTVDTKAPVAPTIASDTVNSTNQVVASGTAEANSTLKVYDGTTLVGTTTTNATGNWTVTSSPLSNGAHTLTATATDAAGNTSAISSPLNPAIGTAIESAGSTSLTQVGSHYDLNNGGSGPELKIGAAAVVAGQTSIWTPIGAEQTANGYEVAWKVAGADHYMIWSTDSNGTYISSVQGTGVAIASFETSFHQDLNGDGVIGVPSTVIESFGSTSLTQVGNNYDLYAGGSGPSLKIDGATVVAGQTSIWTPIGAEHTANGYEVAWKVAGADHYMIWNTDSNGTYINSVQGTGVEVASFETSFHQDLNGDGTIGVPTTNAPASAVELTDVSKSSLGIVTLKGTADASSDVQILDGTNAVGTVTSANDGTWTYASSSAVSNTVHTFTAQELDSTGHVGASSGSAFVGSTGSNTLTSTAGNDLFVGNGSHDTFVFAQNFGKDVINDFSAGSRGHDVIQFSTSVFDSFASVLAHATQVGQDVVIAADATDSLTLKNVKLAALDNTDFHFA